MPRQKVDPRQEQRRRCVVSLANDKMAEGLPVDRAVDAAFAICIRSLQQAGYLQPGSARPTARGALRSFEKLLAPQARSKRLEYEALLAAARTLRAQRRSGGKPVDLDAIVANVTGGSGVDLDTIVAGVTSTRLRGAANVLPLPGSRNVDLCRELTKLRKAMDEVFRCDTAFGDCRIEEGYPSAGHCMLAAMVVQDLFGGQIMFGQVGGVPHYWNRMDDGRDVDLTGDQFGEAPVRAKRAELNGGGVVFEREPGTSLAMPTNAELMQLHERFVGRLTPMLRKQGNKEWAKLLAAQQRQRKVAA